MAEQAKQPMWDCSKCPLKNYADSPHCKACLSKKPLNKKKSLNKCKTLPINDAEHSQEIPQKAITIMSYNCQFCIDPENEGNVNWIKKEKHLAVTRKNKEQVRDHLTKTGKKLQGFGVDLVILQEVSDCGALDIINGEVGYQHSYLIKARIPRKKKMNTGDDIKTKDNDEDDAEYPEQNLAILTNLDLTIYNNGARTVNIILKTPKGIIQIIGVHLFRKRSSAFPQEEPAQIEHALNYKAPTYKTIIVGDFNLKPLEIKIFTESNTAKPFIEIKPKIDTGNYANILDHIFATKTTTGLITNAVAHYKHRDLSDHAPVTFNLAIPQKKMVDFYDKDDFDNTGHYGGYYGVHDLNANIIMISIILLLVCCLSIFKTGCIVATSINIYFFASKSMEKQEVKEQDLTV